MIKLYFMAPSYGLYIVGSVFSGLLKFVTCSYQPEVEVEVVLNFENFMLPSAQYCSIVDGSSLCVQSICFTLSLVCAVFEMKEVEVQTSGKLLGVSNDFVLTG